MKIYVVKNVAMETAGYFLKRENAEKCAEEQRQESLALNYSWRNGEPEKWFVIEVEVN